MSWIETIENLAGHRDCLVRRLDFFPGFVVVWTPSPETVRERLTKTVRILAVKWKAVEGEDCFWVEGRGKRGWKGMVLKEIAE